MRFMEAKKVNVYTIDELAGYWSKITSTEARDRPDAVRAKLGKRISWFVPSANEVNLVFGDDLSNLDDIIQDETES